MPDTFIQASKVFCRRNPDQLQRNKAVDWVYPVRVSVLTWYVICRGAPQVCSTGTITGFVWKRNFNDQAFQLLRVSEIASGLVLLGKAN